MRPEKKQLDLTEEEKVILELLKTNKTLSLDELKMQAALSGKKWDKSMKTLAHHDLIKVIVDGDRKTVKLKV